MDRLPFSVLFREFLFRMVDFEGKALVSAKAYAVMIAMQGIAWGIARWLGSSEEDALEFEDLPALVIQPLGLTKDGKPPRYVANGYAVAH